LVKTFIGALLAASLSTGVAQAAAPDSLVAHRGFGGDAQVKYGVPEDSREAWAKAIELADSMIYVDMDVQNASDGMVVMHDSTIDRTTNRSGRVRDLSLGYIKGAFLELPIDRDGNGNDDNTPYHPPSANEAAAFLSTKRIDGQLVKIALEAKGGGWSQTQVNKLANVFRNNNIAPGRILFHSFDPIVLLRGEIAGFTNRGYVVVGDDALPSAALVKQFGSYVYVRIDRITPEKLDEYHAAGLRVAVWTLNNDEEYTEALNIDADLWVCDDIVEAQGKLAGLP
jgi:glycerophosphoryl diester phosphodiesterase